MLGGDAIEPRHEFIHARVVLHGAGAQRIHAQIDGVIPCRESRKVANHFNLADLGEMFHAITTVVRAQCLSRIDCRYVERRQFERALPRRRFLEDQPFILIRMSCSLLDSLRHFCVFIPLPTTQNYSGCSKARRTPATSRSMSSRLVVSVTHTKAFLVSSG